jgi:hypothetical protein
MYLFSSFRPLSKKGECFYLACGAREGWPKTREKNKQQHKQNKTKTKAKKEERI